MKILIVEDDEFFREWMSKTLTKLGHSIVTACDGNEALQKNQDGHFDMMITDILMPNKEGIELIQEVRDVNSRIKILAITSGETAGYNSFTKLAETVGANASLQKPFTTVQLTHRINELCGAGYTKASYE